MSDPAATTYRFTFEPWPHRVRVEYRGIEVADSRRVMVLRETRLPPVFYFPREDVRMDLMRKSSYRTHCPFKGNAAHYSLAAGEACVENAAWCYEETLEEAREIEGWIAFYPERVEIREEEGAARSKEPGVEDYANPLLGWLLREAPALATPVDLTAALARRMMAAGVPLARLKIVIRTLHPLLAAYSYSWSRKSGEVAVIESDHARLQTPAYLDSPLRAIFEGAGGLRRRLEGERPLLDYEILRELHVAGATDYVAMPLPFSDGQINAITLASDRPGGFSTRDLGFVHEILAVLGSLYEVHAQRSKSVMLLDTYLGSHAGRRVLEGSIRRGDGENIESVIWFCDLRDSTILAGSMSRREFLGCLNQFFDCMAGAVLEHGGQVLRFIGDAALAIFPLDGEDGNRVPAAFDNALKAVADAGRKITETNAARAARGWSPLVYGIGLHVGEVTYGNIGTNNRLEFTVIGDAANIAARIESLCKELGQPVLVSEEFARWKPGRFATLGSRRLRGVTQPLEIFYPLTEGGVYSNPHQ